MLKLDILPCEKADQGTQRCRLGPNVLKSLDGRLGNYVKIYLKGNMYLCSLWPKTDLDEESMQLDETVTIVTTIKGKDTHSSNAVIELISSSPCIKVKLTIMVSEVGEVKTFRQLVKNNRDLVNEYCINCLCNMCVMPNVEVNLEKSQLGNCYGITLVQVHSIETQMDTEGGVILPRTDIEIAEVISKEKYSQRKTNQDAVLAGLDKATDDLVDIINLRQQCEHLCETWVDLPRGVLLRGPPGCGKTTLVKHVAGLCDAHLVTISGPELFTSRPGESEENLRTVFNKACLLSEEGACLLFIDELDSVCPKRGKSGNGQECRVTGQLLALMDGIQSTNHLVVIGATNRPQALDPAIRRPGRFDREVMINIPTEAQRCEILNAHTSYLPLDEDVDFAQLSSWTKGYVGADLSMLCHEAAYAAMSELSSRKAKLPVVRVSMQHFKSAFGKILPSTQKGSEAWVDLKPVSWTDIGGLEEIKGQIKQAVEWPINHPEAFIRMGIPRPSGVLLYGPPGCCKTTLVKAAATSCKATFLSVSAAQLYSPIVGEAERALTEVFRRARMGSPAILFLDEIDAIAGKRSESGGHRGVQERLLSTLLNEMDGIGMRLDEKWDSTEPRPRLTEGDTDHSEVTQDVKVVVDNDAVLVVAATNRPDLVDEALLRPGRFDRLIYVPPPDESARHQILKVHTRKIPTTDVDIESLAKNTEWFTGADLENLCREAALCALTKDGLNVSSVTQEHFSETLHVVKSSLSPSLVAQYRSITSQTFDRKKWKHEQV